MAEKSVSAAEPVLCERRAIQSRLGAISTGAEPPMLSGHAIVPAHDCWYPPAVDVVDLLRVDFDQRAIGQDGLYLVEELGPAGVIWRGCRRFNIRPLSGALKMDADGRGSWIDANLAGWRWRVVGYVEEVYKPARQALRSAA